MCPTCDLTHSYPCHNSFIHTHACDTTPLKVWHNSFLSLYMCPTYDLTHSYPYHNSFIHTHTCDMIPLKVWRNSFTYILPAIWRIYTRAITHPYTWHDSFVHVIWRIYTQVPRLSDKHDMTDWHLHWSNASMSHVACMNERMKHDRNVTNDINVINKTWHIGTYIGPILQRVMLRVRMSEWDMTAMSQMTFMS